MTTLFIADKGPLLVDLADYFDIRECHWAWVNYFGAAFFNALMTVLMSTFKTLTVFLAPDRFSDISTMRIFDTRLMGLIRIIHLETLVTT